jgi:hypothetical protein
MSIVYKAGKAGLALLFVLSVASPAAHAQSAAPVKATVAPPPGEEAGWHVIQFANGYARFRVEPGDDQTEEQGGVTIEPAPPRASPGRNAEPETQPPTAEGEELSAPAPVDPCLEEQGLLSQRLMELRGVKVDPATALLAVSQLESPLSSFVALSVLGRPTPLVGGTFLANVLSWDTKTRQLTASLMQCLSARQD